MMTKLSKVLTDTYCDQERHTGEQRLLIRIDDHTPDDVYRGFCNIHLMIPEPDAGTLKLILDNVPHDPEVEAIAKDLQGTWRTTPAGRTLSVSLTVQQVPEIRRLATAIRQVVARVKRYPDRNWKWIAPRTADSLERLAEVLLRAAIDRTRN
jgi:hypothetical protein